MPFRSKTHPDLKPDMFRQEALIRYLDDLNLILANSETPDPKVVADKHMALEQYLEVTDRLYILRERLLHEVTLWERILAFFGR